MQNLAPPVRVRQVDGDDLDAWEHLAPRFDPRVGRAIRAPDDKRALVQPERVAVLREGRFLQAGDDRHACGLEIGRQRLRLALPRGLPRTQENGAVRRDQHGVVDVDRVEVARLAGRLDLLCTTLGQQRPEAVVLDLGCLLPAEPLLRADVFRLGRSDDDPPETLCAPRASIRCRQSRELLVILGT